MAKPKKILKKLEQENAKIYLVGGAVRDNLLNKPTQDKDYVILGLNKSRFKKIFPDAKRVGQSFPIYITKINGEKSEVALARNRKTGKPVSNLKDDLKGRDLTINAMAIDMHDNKLIDYFSGKQDLEKGILRGLPYLEEDPLRFYRICRFAVRYGFDIEKKTVDKARKNKNKLKRIDKERVFAEVNKAIGETQKPSEFFRLLDRLDILNIHFSLIAELKEIPQPQKQHPEGSVFEHSLQTLDQMAKLTQKKELLFASLLHDIGKINTPKNILPHHYKHSYRGGKTIKMFYKTFDMPNNYKKIVGDGIRLHDKMHYVSDMGLGKLYDFLIEVDNSRIGFNGLTKLHIADKKGREGLNKEYKPFYSSRELKFLVNIIKKAVNGKNTQLPNNPKAKDILKNKRCQWMHQNLNLN